MFVPAKEVNDGVAVNGLPVADPTPTRFGTTGAVWNVGGGVEAEL
jgi:hypothetical protein